VPPDYELDNQLRSRLRNEPRSTAYIRRSSPSPQRRIQDISFAKTQPAAIKPKSSHPTRLTAPVNPSSKIHHKPALAAADRPVRQPVKVRKARKRPVFSSQTVLYSMAVMIFALGLSASLISLRTNQKAQAQVNKISSGQNNNGDGDILPSTKKPSDAEVSAYKAPADLPRYLDIPSLKVHARVYAIGTNKKGELGAPANIYNTAWYKKSSKPGQPGAMLIDGHSGLNIDGVFNGLTKLKKGDLINVKRGDGRVFTYSVVKTQVFPAEKVDMASLLVSADTSNPGLNLISCTGDRIPGTYALNQRVAVYAVLQ
jgi:LPXTG-site transpeptidase (sortase) family protein